MAKRVGKATSKDGKVKRRKQDEVEDERDFFLMDDDNEPAANDSEEEEAEETAEEKRLRLGRSGNRGSLSAAAMLTRSRSWQGVPTAGAVALLLTATCSSGVSGAYTRRRRG
jgi:hypothetical protein